MSGSASSSFGIAGRYSIYLGVFLVSLMIVEFAQARGYQRPVPGDVFSQVGPRDGVLVAGGDGEVLISKNAEKLLIPASIIKVLTSLVAITSFGPEYRFPTEFYVGEGGELKIKGYGDPLLVSESVQAIAAVLAGMLEKVEGLVLDDSFFEKPLEIPGTAAGSEEPYDAPNGALSVNFNTVRFKTSADNRYVSAEPQTPLLPIARERIRASATSAGRIVFASDGDEATRYAGQLFRHFLNREGIHTGERIVLGRVVPGSDRLIYRYLSTYPLVEVVRRLLKYSNNFVANQLLISAGAEAYGAPGTLEKGIRAALEYAKGELHMERIRLAEGSGISRATRVTAEDFMKALDAFQSYCFLMRSENGVLSKTGTLHGVSTRAGYVSKAEGGLARFVVMVNTPGKSCEPIVSRILSFLEENTKH